MDPLQILQQLLVEAGAERRRAAVEEHLASQRSIGRTIPPAGFKEDATISEHPVDRMPLLQDNAAASKVGGTGEYPPTKGPAPAAGQVQYPVYKEPPRDRSESQVHQQMAEVNKDFIRRRGYDFRGADHNQAAKVIADQLLLQRAVRDPFVFERYYSVNPQSDEDRAQYPNPGVARM